MKKYIVRYNSLTKQRGLTLTELMVDLVLTSFIIGVLASVYIAYKKNNEIQFDNIIINNNAIAAFNYIKNDFKLVGFYGCNSDSTSIEYAMTPTIDQDLSTAISAFDANQTGMNSNLTLSNPSIGWSPELAGQVADVSPDDGSDVITVKFADTNPAATLASATTGDTLTVTNLQFNISDGDVLLISDCLRTVLFQVDTIAGNTIIPTQSVGILNATAEIYKVNVNSYYVKTVDSISSLYRLSNGNETLLIPNIENIQLLFGEDTSANSIPDRFITGNSIADNTILSLEIGLLIKSNGVHNNMSINNSHEVLASPAPFNTTVTITTPGDSYFRKAYDFTISLPNA